METAPYELLGASLNTKSEIKNHVRNIVLGAHNTVVVNVEQKKDNMDIICAFVEILNRVGQESNVVPILYLNFENSSAQNRVVNKTPINENLANLANLANVGKLNCLLKIDFLTE